MAYNHNFQSGSKSQAPNSGPASRQFEHPAPPSYPSKGMAQHPNTLVAATAGCVQADSQQGKLHHNPNSEHTQGAICMASEKWWECCHCKTPYASSRTPSCVTTTNFPDCFGHRPCHGCRTWTQQVNTAI